MSIGSLGPVVFETSQELVRNFQELEERRHARYATHDVLGLEQKLQFLGLDLTEVNLQMRFHHRFCRPRRELERLQGLLAGHEAHWLVIDGRPLGVFVLEEVKAVWRHLTDLGELLFVQADVCLREYR